MGFAQRLNDFANLFGQGVQFPTPHEARWITDSVKYSPDLGWLEQFEYQLLFCADDTREGYSHHSLISESEHVATAFTANKFRYWMQQAGQDRLPIPIIEQHGETNTIRYFPPLMKIRGEIRLVRTPQFRELDNYKRNTVQFRRRRLNVFVFYRDAWPQENIIDPNDRFALFRKRELPRALQGTKHWVYSSRKMEIIRCWMYTGNPAYWNDLLDGGFRGFKTVNNYLTEIPAVKEYYDFPKQPL